jgi:hypothetical protein
MDMLPNHLNQTRRPDLRALLSGAMLFGAEGCFEHRAFEKT